MIRTVGALSIAAVLVGAASPASAQQKNFTVVFKDHHGNPVRDARVHFWSKDLGDIKFDATNKDGAVELPHNVTDGHSYEAVYCPGPPPTINILEHGMMSAALDACGGHARGRQFGDVTWGKEAMLEFSNVRDEGEYDVIAGAAIGASTLADGEQKCASASAELQSINSVLVPSCTFEATKPDFRIYSGLSWKFLEARVGYQQAHGFQLNSSATAGSVVVNTPGTLDEHAWDLEALAGWTLPMKRKYVIMAGLGVMPWSLHNDSGFQVLNHGQVTSNQPSSQDYSGTGWLFDAGVRIPVYYRFNIEAGYQLRKFNDDSMGLHERIDTFSVGGSVQIGLR